MSGKPHTHTHRAVCMLPVSSHVEEKIHFPLLSINASSCKMPHRGINELGELGHWVVHNDQNSGEVCV